VSGGRTEGVPVGIILSGATTEKAICQLYEDAEKGRIRVGMLLLVRTENRKILARVAEITPYNEFYNKGDVWSESRRKKEEIPADIARSYTICELELLIEVPASDVKIPPKPGDEVYSFDPSQHAKEIYGVSLEDAGYIWLGTLLGYEDKKVPIPLNVENIPMHLAILGVTGSGKSYTTGVLIEKLTEIKAKDTKVSYPMIVIDAHGDYLSYAEHYMKSGKLGNVGWIRRYVFPKAYESPKLRDTYGEIIHPIAIDLDRIPVRELAKLIILYYKGSLEGADMQLSGLENLLERVKEEYGESEGIKTFFEGDDFDSEVRRFLEEAVREGNLHHSTKHAIQRSIKSFRDQLIDYNLISYNHEDDLVEYDPEGKNVFVEKITREGGLAIFDFSPDGAPGVDLKTKQLVIAYLSTLLFDSFTQYKMEGEDRYLLIIIEEAQNFCPDKSYPIGVSLAHEKLSAIATQGRKFGLSLCIISQRPSFVDRTILSMCNTFIIHRISPEDVGFVMNVTGGLPKSLRSRLTNMATGDAIVTGQMLTTQFPLAIHILEEDRKIKSTISETNVVKTLYSLRGL